MAFTPADRKASEVPEGGLRLAKVGDVFVLLSNVDGADLRNVSDVPARRGGAELRVPGGERGHVPAPRRDLRRHNG